MKAQRWPRAVDLLDSMAGGLLLPDLHCRTAALPRCWLQALEGLAALQKSLLEMNMVPPHGCHWLKLLKLL